MCLLLPLVGETTKLEKDEFSALLAGVSRQLDAALTAPERIEVLTTIGLGPFSIRPGTVRGCAKSPRDAVFELLYTKESKLRACADRSCCLPAVLAGNDFSTLYAPLIRDGRMEKFYWNPTREDRIGVCMGIFMDDDVTRGGERQSSKLGAEALAQFYLA